MRTVDWQNDAVQMIDQRILPGRFEVITYDDYREIAKAITDMVVRGAPAIGAAGGFGMALAARQSPARDRDSLLIDLAQAKEVLDAARPTAVNLAWATSRMLDLARRLVLPNTDDIRSSLLVEAKRIADEDVEVNKRMAMHGATLINDGDTVLHHCNTGALATVDYGTALGAIRMAHELGKHIHVLVDETRPRLQGARLTAWELKNLNIPFDLIADNAAGYFMYSGQVKAVFVGADRVAANGDAANKIGTYKLAVVAKENNVPFYVVAPTSTVDLSLPDGGHIPIEERSMTEVLNLEIGGEPVAPEGITARNPAFDVTPHRYITAIVTENGVVRPPYVEGLRKAVEGK
ncbi:MAG: S-methyl-5-thioribose-1-phosphate isomerase [Chloroflexi bacterium]|nr:S-methyl-5-thioribose-1-phosphate isomerase [Chloroflexota bacterium]